MKWAAILFFVAVVGVFYLMGDRPTDEFTTQDESVNYQQDSFDEFDNDRVDGPSWQNKRADKIMPLGSNLD